MNNYFSQFVEFPVVIPDDFPSMSCKVILTMFPEIIEGTPIDKQAIKAIMLDHRFHDKREFVYRAIKLNNSKVLEQVLSCKPDMITLNHIKISNMLMKHHSDLFEVFCKTFPDVTHYIERAYKLKSPEIIGECIKHVSRETLHSKVNSVLYNFVIEGNLSCALSILQNTNLKLDMKLLWNCYLNCMEGIEELYPYIELSEDLFMNLHVSTLTFSFSDFIDDVCKKNPRVYSYIEKRMTEEAQRNEDDMSNPPESPNTPVGPSGP